MGGLVRDYWASYLPYADSVNQTSPKLIGFVVGAIAIDSTIGLCVLSYCLIMGLTPDQVLLTSFIGMTTGLFGTLAGMLISTRSAQPGATESTTTTTITPAPVVPKPGDVTEVKIVNPASEPANVKEVKK